jgi:hypothetical protein
MGTSAKSATVIYRLSFADKEKQTSVFLFFISSVFRIYLFKGQHVLYIDIYR